MPEPIKQALWGVQSLIAHPDARVMLIQGQDNFAAAQRMFPANPVLGFEGDIGQWHVGLAGRDVVAWAANPLPMHSRRLGEALATSCEGIGQVAAFSPADPGECWSVAEIERKGLRRDWIVQRLVRIGETTPEPVTAAAEMTTEPPPSAPPKPRKIRPPRWEAMGLILSTQGNPLPTLDNAVRVLEHDPNLAGRIWYDTFLGRVLHTWGVDTPAQWTDADDLRLTLYLQRDIGIGKLAKGTAADAAVTYARRETRNCAYDWLDGLRWDGRERLNLVATRGFGAKDDEYNAAVCRNLILAMVKRIFLPGCKWDYMPIFEGRQGIGKSQALNILGGEWFAELHLSWENKDFFDALKGKMLLEIGEIHAFKQSDVDRIKGIVSCATDRYRASYGRHTEDFPRSCVFAGTTNRDNWNRDDTGARRFWPILCGAIDHVWLRENREQLFAEAVHRIRDGASYWEVPWAQANAEQDERREVDTWEEILRDWTIGKNRLRMSELLADGLKIEVGRQTLSDLQRAGRAMKAIGWKKIVPTYPGPNGKREKIWVRDSDDGTAKRDLLDE